MNLNTIIRGLAHCILALALFASDAQAADRSDAGSASIRTGMETGMGTYAYPADGSHTVIPARLSEPTEKDVQLTNEVKKAIEPFYRNISIDAEEGTVRLRGNVDSLQDRDAIIKDVRSVGGVQSVESYIRVNNK